MIIIQKFVQSIKSKLEANLRNVMSTLSNIFYPIVGVMVWDIEWVLGLSLIVLGVASTGFHALNSKAWHKFDIVAIYYLFAIVACWGWLGSNGLFLGVVLGTFAYVSFDFYSNRSRYIIAFFAVFCLVPLFLYAPAESILETLFPFIMAFGFAYMADNFGVDENNIMYDFLHSIWHFWSAMGIYYLITTLNAVEALPFF